MLKTSPSPQKNLAKIQKRGPVSDVLGHHKRKASHGEHSDDSDRHKKLFVKVNGVSHESHGRVNGRQHKKARHAYGDPVSNNLVNGVGPSSLANIKLQEQRKQLPIAKGMTKLL